MECNTLYLHLDVSMHFPQTSRVTSLFIIRPIRIPKAGNANANQYGVYVCMYAHPRLFFRSRSRSRSRSNQRSRHHRRREEKGREGKPRQATSSTRRHPRHHRNIFPARLNIPRKGRFGSENACMTRYLSMGEWRKACGVGLSM